MSLLNNGKILLFLYYVNLFICALFLIVFDFTKLKHEILFNGIREHFLLFLFCNEHKEKMFTIEIEDEL